jgi:hypothetical protein
MNTIRFALVSASLTGLCIGSAAAQTATEETPAAEPPPADTTIVEQEPDQTLSRNLIGADVMHEEHGKIGNLESLLFDNDDQIVGGIVSIGGFLGIGSKHVALSWDAFNVLPQEEAVYLSLTREQLEAAPTFKDLATIEAEEAARQAEMEYQQQQQQQTQPPQSN